MPGSYNGFGCGGDTDSNCEGCRTGEIHLAALGEDRYKQLKSTVDSWAAEVSEIRSTLADKLQVELKSARPAFRLNRERVETTREAPSPPNPQALLDSRTRIVEADREKERLEAELAFVREQLDSVNREAIEARRIADTKSEQLEEMARSLGRTRLDLNEATEQLRAREWALLQTSNENSMLRGDADVSARPRTVPVDDYDALVESHMSIRAEVAALQERVIQREHEILALREGLSAAQAELAAWESVGPASGAGIAKLAGVIAERSAALEKIESTAQGQELLIAALREELDVARTALDGREFDHERVVQALRLEMESLRAVSSERDFVIGHQSQSIELISIRETELRTELAETREKCEALRERAREAADERETLGRELQLLRAKMAERESEVWRLRAAPSPPAATEPGLVQLQAALASRDAELVRARERISFLRGQGRASAGLTAMAQVFELEEAAPVAQEPKSIVPPDLALGGLQVNSELQREVEEALAAEFPWHLIAIVGGIAGLGLLSLGLLALVLV